MLLGNRKYRIPDEITKYNCHIVGKQLKTTAIESFVEIENFLADDLENCGPYQGRIIL